MEELTSDELKAMEKLSKERFDIGELEAKIMNQLAVKEFVNRQQKNSIMKKVIFQIAASVALLICGYLIGKVQLNNTPINNDQNMYALFLYENEEFTPSENLEALVEEYADWTIDLVQQEKLVAAEKLNDFEKYWVGKPSVQNQTSQLSGYFVFYATSFSEAKAIAATHPHITYGGGLELRPIDQIN